MAPFDQLRDIQESAEGYVVNTLPTAHGGVLGAHLLFQHVLIAERAAPGRRVLELQMSFIRGGYAGEPATATVETVNEGRSFSFIEITFRQRGILTCRSEILLTVDEDDYLRVQAAPAEPTDFSGWEQGGPMWPGTRRLDPSSTRIRRVMAMEFDTPVDATTTRALLAMASEPEVHVALFSPATPDGRPILPTEQSSFVLKQTVTFLEEADLSSGVIFRTVADYAGRGRSHGHGEVFDPSGRLLATFAITGVMRSAVR
jgi:acyl-CoA thioesterase II